MSEVNGSAEEQTQNLDVGSADEQADNRSADSVDYETYKKAVSREKSLKQRLAEAEAKAKEFDQWKKEQEEKKLMDEKRYKDLLSRREEELKREREARSSIETQMISSLKKQALERELGGVKKPEYLSFADLSAIEVDENGQIVAETLKYVAEKYKDDHPDLLKSTPKGMPSGAPKSPFKADEGDINQVSYKDAIAKHFKL